jgi:hypothetical protein
MLRGFMPALYVSGLPRNGNPGKIGMFYRQTYWLKPGQWPRRPNAMVAKLSSKSRLPKDF